MNDTHRIDPATPPQPLPPPSRERPRSLVLLNTGDGKGKSTAAFGVVMRAVARDWRVCVIQFIKSGKWKVGEEKIGRQLGVEWHSLGEGFTWDSTNLEHDKEVAQQAWQVASDAIASGKYRLVILDELTYLCTWGWVDTEAVVTALRDRPDNVNVIVTGRDCPSEIIEIADTVTEMRKVKHAYDKGIAAKKGIEY